MSALRYGSLFSGIGGFDLGFDRAGLECAWQVEIDRDCLDVLTRHWPEVERYGDIREVGVADLAPVDVIVGGFPCQDVSVAGHRAGLAGARSGLWWEFHRILGELRPAWVVIENVPGLLSSHGGRDMGTVLGALGDLGYGWAYRVLDAQWFGVAQRRRRVFIVGHLGDKRAAQVLLEPEDGGWDTPPSRTPRTRVAASLTAGSHGPGVNRPGRRLEDDESVVTQSLTGAFGSGGADDNKAQAGFLVPAVSLALTAPHTTSRHDASVETFVKTARAQSADAPERWDALPVALTLNGFDSGDARATAVAVTHALTAEGHDASEDGTGRGTPIIAVGRGFYTLTSEELAQPVTTRNGDPGHVFTSASVRRLTPVECERLQGFPDGWTALGATETARIERDIAALMATRPGFAEALAEAAASSYGQADLADMVRWVSDSARYRMLGNAVAVPCAEWIGRRLAEASP